MDLMLFLVSFVVHIDKHLDQLIDMFGVLTYVILFLIVFCETGLVVTPFLPGDSLLFALGAFAARGSLDLWLCYVLMLIAAIGGNTVNYFIGRKVGDSIYNKGGNRLIKKENIDRTIRLFEKHGGKTIVITRFMPIIRTFAPFVAGMGKMDIRRFVIYNIFGGFIWVTLFMLVGYFFGNMPVVEENFSMIILGIVGVSFLPVVVAKIASMISGRKA